MTWAILGWKIGGVNLEVARLDSDVTLPPAPAAARSRPLDLRRDADRFGGLCAELARDVGAGPGASHAVVLGSTLASQFRSVRAAVQWTLEALVATFPDAPIHVLGGDGEFRTVTDAQAAPRVVAGAAWRAAAGVLAEVLEDALLVDVGAAATHVSLVEDGVVRSVGGSAAERSVAGELLFTGAVRTPVESLLHRVPLWQGSAAVAPSGLALMGDVHLWRGALEPADYVGETPDGLPATRGCAGERIARAMGSDREELDEMAIGLAAAALAAAQVEQVRDAMARRLDAGAGAARVIVSGLGDFVALEAARELGLPGERLAGRWGRDASRTAAAVGAAWLLGRAMAGRA